MTFLPGARTHPLLYEEFCDALARAGFTVVGLHGQGHGKSPRVRRPLTLGALVTNARDAVGWARREVSDRVVACGSSQGGVLAMAVATVEPQLTAVVAHNILDPRLPDSLLVTPVPGTPAAGLPRAAGRAPDGRPGRPGVAGPVRRLPGDGPGHPRSGDRRLLLDRPLRDGSIRCPVLVVAGRGDPLSPLGYTRQVFDEIVAPAKELLVVETDVHLLFVEALEATLPPLLQRLRALTAPVSRPTSPAPGA
ncbi:MAG TPA: alpha/beta hydrolase [Actinomycetes bacterium]